MTTPRFSCPCCKQPHELPIACAWRSLAEQLRADLASAERRLAQAGIESLPDEACSVRQGPSDKALALARERVWLHRQPDGCTTMYVCNGILSTWSVVFEAGTDEQNIQENLEVRVDEIARFIQMGLDHGRSDESQEQNRQLSAEVARQNREIALLKAAVADFFDRGPVPRSGFSSWWGYEIPRCRCGEPATYDGTGKGNGYCCDAHLPEYDQHDWHEFCEADAIRVLTALGALPKPQEALKKDRNP